VRRACVRECERVRASERVVYLAECEARLRTTVKEVSVSYGVEGERRRACVPLRESRIEHREPRLPQVGRPPIRSIRETRAIGIIQGVLQSGYPTPSLFLSSRGAGYPIIGIQLRARQRVNVETPFCSCEIESLSNSIHREALRRSSSYLAIVGILAIVVARQVSSDSL